MQDLTTDELTTDCRVGVNLLRHCAARQLNQPRYTHDSSSSTRTRILRAEFATCRQCAHWIDTEEKRFLTKVPDIAQRGKHLYPMVIQPSDYQTRPNLDGLGTPTRVRNNYYIRGGIER